MLCQYLDNFIAVFVASTTEDQIRKEELAYNWIIDLLGISKNHSKNYMRTKLSIFGIRVNSIIFTTRLPKAKLERAIKKIREVLSNNSNSILHFDIQLLVSFLLFYFQAL